MTPTPKKYLTFIASFLLLIYALNASAAVISNPSCNPPGSNNCVFVDLSNRGGNTFASLGLLVVKFLLGIVGIISILFIIIGGFQYVTSRGSEEQAEAGKKTLSNAIIGLVIVILSYVIVAVVINALKGKV